MTNATPKAPQTTMTQAERETAIAANIEAAERYERLGNQRDADIAWAQAAALMSLPVPPKP